MKNTQVSFIQIADQIPYTKITSFTVKEVAYANDAFEIRLDRKCESLPEEKQYKIKRNLADFKWLIEQIKKESPWVAVLPTLVQSSWSITNVISLQDQEKTKTKKWYADMHLLSMIERFLKMMSQVVLQNIYKVPGFRQSSLYTFLDKSYELYRSQKYQETNTKQVQVVHSPFYSFANSIGKGSMKLLGMLNVIKQEQNRKYMQIKAKSLTQIKVHLEWLNHILDGYSKSLQNMLSNFLGEKQQLRYKQNQIFDTQLKLNNVIKYISQVLQQMSSVSKNCQILQKKGDEKSNTKEQIAAYEKFMTQQETYLNSQYQKIVAEFYEKCLHNQVEIRLKNVYSFKV